MFFINNILQGITKPVCPFFWTKPVVESAEDSEEDESDEEEVITDENLQFILDYLRETHLYCIYCGIKGTDEEDLKANCPGPYRVDHSDDLD